MSMILEQQEKMLSSQQFGYQPGWLTGALPVVMHEDDLFVRFVQIFEEIASSVRFAVERTSDVADITVTPTAMVRFLGSWVSAPAIHSDLASILQRRIVRAAGDTLAIRGTACALEHLLRVVTGGNVSVHDSGGVFADGQAGHRSASVVVRLEKTGHLSKAEIEQLIQAEVPAHIPVDVVFEHDRDAVSHSFPLEVSS
jgi:phage tail-like protein